LAAPLVALIAVVTFLLNNRRLPEHSTTGRVVRTGEAVITTDASAEPDASPPDWTNADRVRSALIAPLIQNMRAVTDLPLAVGFGVSKPEHVTELGRQADAVVVGVLIAVHDAVNRFWWLPASGLAVAGVLLLATIWPRELDTGPRWQTFYERFGSGTALEVARYMLAELLEALDANDEAAAPVFKAKG